MKEKSKENKKENKKEETRDEEIIKLAAAAKHWENEYYRAYADMQNLRKQIEAEHKEALKYRIEGFVDNLLPVLDGFHLALNAEASTKEMQNFLVGFSYIYKNLVSILENEGVTEFNPKVGDAFDPKIMQALEVREDEGEENRVLEVKTRGYKLHEHLVRPALVVVSVKHKEEENTEATNNKEENNCEADA